MDLITPVKNHLPTLKKLLLVLLVVLITTVGTGLRFYAANRLPIDYDERVYLQAAVRYNNFLREGRWTMLAWDDYAFEHPSFYKIMYGFALFTQPPLEKFDKEDFVLGMSIAKIRGKPWGLAGRFFSVISGGLTIFTLSIINPLAGLFFATDTLAVKYNSTLFLEALPTLANLLAALCYLHWYRKTRYQLSRENLIWLAMSAGFLGMSVACKYTYGVVGVAIAIHLAGSVLLKKVHPKALWLLAAWGILALAVFFVCDPYLWKHTFSRLIGTLTYHRNHTQSEEVIKLVDCQACFEG